jgi:signal peptidase II
MKRGYYLLWVLALLALDQLSKLAAYEYLDLSRFFSVEVTSFFSLTFAQNYGAAFSFLAGGDGWQRYFLSGVSIVASIFLLGWLFKTPRQFKFQLIGITLVLAGAMGNMIDRIFQGFVIDFLHFHYDEYSFPIFNLADTFIFLGVVSIIFHDWFVNKHLKK